MGGYRRRIWDDMGGGYGRIWEDMGFQWPGSMVGQYESILMQPFPLDIY